MIRPALRLIWLLTVPFSAAVIAIFVPQFVAMVWVLVALLILLAAIDLRVMVRPRELTGRREAKSTFAVGVRQPIDLVLHNHSRRVVAVEVFDLYPGEHMVHGMPSSQLLLPPGGAVDLRYVFVPVRRGTFQFGRIQMRALSPLGLWDHRFETGESLEIRVYPDYARVLQSGLLAACQRLDMIGIHKRRQRGEGTEFHQLRQFRPGDRLNQINWKSTSKHREIISNQYQEERDQRVLVLIDCSHRMRSCDGQLSHFDQALNAAILLSWFAVRQGDAVGLMTFGGTESRYVAPGKSPAVVSRMLDAMFDLHPSPLAPDYREAFTKVLTLVRKRSLVVIVTTLRDDARDELAAAIRPLTGRHLVLLANIREAVIDEVSRKPVDNLDDALTYFGAQEYDSGVAASLGSLHAVGCSVVTATAQALPITVTNHYLALKQAGRI